MFQKMKKSRIQVFSKKELRTLVNKNKKQRLSILKHLGSTLTM